MHKMQSGGWPYSEVGREHAVLEVGVKQRLRECGTKRQKAGS